MCYASFSPMDLSFSKSFVFEYFVSVSIQGNCLHNKADYFLIMDVQTISWVQLRFIRKTIVGIVASNLAVFLCVLLQEV